MFQFAVFLDFLFAGFLQIEKELILHITMFAEVENSIVTVTDCRHADVRVTLEDTDVFRVKSGNRRT